jgi:glutaminyl-peptide cyclotransferase
MSRMAGAASIALLLVLLGCLLMIEAGKDDGGFASDRFPPLPDPLPFDAKRAMGYLEDICKIGARISGTAGMKKQQDLLEKHFKDLDGKITWQRFTARQVSVEKTIEMANLIVSWHPERKRRVILCSHYDTRPIADQEPRFDRWHDRFVSANDGGSGVALLMEMAHHMKDLKSEVGVDFVFFDGEECVFRHTGDTYFFGSRHFGQQYRRRRDKTVYAGAILLDMVGGKKARFPQEPNSVFLERRMVDDVWAIAGALKCDAFVARQARMAVEDDHIELNKYGIPAIDIIDFEYPHWHRLTDLPENCSGESLEQVARVLSVWLQKVK